MLRALKKLNSIELFGTLICLNYNLDKTFVMPIVSLDTKNIKLFKELCFSIRDNFDILSINLKTNLDNVNDIFLKIKNKFV